MHIPKKSLTPALGAAQPKWTQLTAGDWPEHRQRPSSGSRHGELNTELPARADGQVAPKLEIRKHELSSSTKVREKKYFRWKQRLERKG